MVVGIGAPSRNFGQLLNLQGRPPRAVLPPSFSQRLFAKSAGATQVGQVAKTEYKKDVFFSSHDGLLTVRGQIEQVRDSISWLPAAEISNTQVDSWISDIGTTITNLEGLADFGTSEELQSTKTILNQVQVDLATAKDDTAAASPKSDAALLTDLQNSQTAIQAAMTAIDPLRDGGNIYDEAYRELEAADTLITNTTLSDDVQGAGQISYYRISNAQGLLASVASTDPNYATVSPHADALLTEKQTLEPSVVAVRESQDAKSDRLAQITPELDRALQLTGDQLSQQRFSVQFEQSLGDPIPPARQLGPRGGGDYLLQRSRSFSAVGMRVDLTSSAGTQASFQINEKDKSFAFLRRI